MGMCLQPFCPMLPYILAMCILHHSMLVYSKWLKQHLQFFSGEREGWVFIHKKNSFAVQFFLGSLVTFFKFWCLLTPLPHNIWPSQKSVLNGSIMRLPHCRAVCVMMGLKGFFFIPMMEIYALFQKTLALFQEVALFYCFLLGGPPPRTNYDAMTCWDGNNPKISPQKIVLMCSTTNE